jgi:hypothetical protein
MMQDKYARAQDRRKRNLGRHISPTDSEKSEYLAKMEIQIRRGYDQGYVRATVWRLTACER